MKDSHLESIQDLWQRSLTAVTIAETLESVSAEEDADRALEKMKAHHYDVMGVRDKKGRISLYLEKSKIDKGTCGDNGLPFEIDELVAEQTPLIDCLLHIQRTKRLFVMGSKGVEKIITLADLNKPPVRMLLFSLISLLEMTCLDLIKMEYPDLKWKKILSPKRLQSAKAVFDKRKKRNQEVDLEDCLNLCDKITILYDSENISTQWGFSSNTEKKRFTRQLEHLRNMIAHSHYDNDMDWEKTAELVKRIEQLLEVNFEFFKK